MAMPSYKRLQCILWEALELGWPCRIILNWGKGSKAFIHCIKDAGWSQERSMTLRRCHELGWFFFPQLGESSEETKLQDFSQPHCHQLIECVLSWWGEDWAKHQSTQCTSKIFLDLHNKKRFFWNMQVAELMLYLKESKERKNHASTFNICRLTNIRARKLFTS